MRALTMWQPYLAGVLHGDGWCTRLTIGLRVKDYDFALAFAEALRQEFGAQRPPRRDERGYWLVRAGNKRGTFNGLREYVPRGRVEQAAWLRGMFDSEGNAQLGRARKMGPNSWSRRVAFYSTSQATLRCAADYLSILTITNVTVPQKASVTHIGTKQVYELRVRGGRHNYIVFADIVGSSIARKRDVLDTIPQTYQPPGHHARAQARGAAVRRARRDAGGKY